MINEKLQLRIRDELAARRWTYSDLAEKAGLGVSTVSMVMSGQRNAGPDFCRGVARALGIPAHEIFTLAGILPEREEPSDGSLESVALFLFRQLSEADQQTILKMLEGVVRSAEVERELEERRKRREGGGEGES